MSSKFASIVASVTHKLHPQKQTFKDVVEETVRRGLRADGLRVSYLQPLPKALSDQIPQELFEQFIAHLSGDLCSLAACTTVCRAWFSASRSHLFASLIVSPVFFDFGQWHNINCSVTLRGGNSILYGTDDGVYQVDLRNRNRVPAKRLALDLVTQVDVLEEYNILIVLADSHVLTIPLNTLSSFQAEGFAACTRISSHVSFFKVGILQGATFVCIGKVKAGLASTTFKLMEPTAAPGGGSYGLQLHKEFYISEKTLSVHFLRSKLVAATAHHGFELINIETFHTQALLDPDTILPDEHSKKTKCVALFRLSEEFILCYDTYAMYIDTWGRISRPTVIQWIVQPVVSIGELP